MEDTKRLDVTGVRMRIQETQSLLGRASSEFAAGGVPDAHLARAREMIEAIEDVVRSWREEK